MIKKVNTPLNEESARSLRIGDRVLLSGTVYTARDAGHERLYNALLRGEDLPFPLQGAVIFYVGPSPAKPGSVIGSAGPTTSYRMDSYTPMLLEHGLKGMIGKGQRNEEVKAAIKEFGAVYFAAVGGAGALLAERITDAKIIAFEDLGTEALRQLEVVDFPLIVAGDAEGRDLYIEGPEEYRAQHEIDADNYGGQLQ
ncbi:MAG TPA: Fe-S-containing hydro-lyase [Clostridiaceae bacterium]|nr:Fe-S-containing hydro-lyase [Clostridiaceae bacterium]